MNRLSEPRPAPRASTATSYGVDPPAYDGDHHRTDRYQYVKDIRRRELLERMGWIIITIVAEDRPADIIRRVRDAFARSTVR